MAVLAVLVAVGLLQAATQEEVAQTNGASAEAVQEDDQQVSAVPVKAPPLVVPDPVSVPVEEAAAYPPQAYAPQSSGDRRIQLLTYDPDQIVTLAVSPGFASVVELGEDERVENVVVGNSAAGQVTANRRGDRVIVKPLGNAGPSNLIVLTGSRRYVFVLDPFGETSFIMRFRYPQAVQAAAATATAASGAPLGYRFRGNKGLFPLAMSDDGRRTTIRWGEQNVLPAIFSMNDGRNEQLVNGRMVGNDYVIEGAAPRYKFRYGTAEATAIRQTPKRRR
ncbi:MAG: TrbG/VirB9 family P-type conjugative transfer protein [Sphingomonas bacterium]|nr:TrbG/VirB9 family P-type conjugative transfer protein [Sphingomonas bacterium]